MAGSKSVIELHIDVQQGLKRQDANRRNKVYSEEIDWVLNKMVDRKIKDSIKPDPAIPYKFQVDTKALSDIQPLIVSGLSLPVEKERNEDNLYSVTIPNDFAYLLDIRGKSLQDCDSVYSNVVVTDTKSISSLRFPLSEKTEAPFYNILQLSTQSQTIFDISGYNISKGLTSKNEQYVVRNLMLEALRNKIEGIDFYWEKYGEYYQANTFYIVDRNFTTSSFSLNLDSQNYNSKVIVNSGILPLKVNQSLGTKLIANRPRLIKQDFVSDALDSYYSSPKLTTPLAYLANDKIFLRTTDNYLAHTVIIDYVRKPRQINLALNQSSDIGASAQNEISDLAIEYFKNILNDPSYNQKVQDNQLRMQ